MLKQVIAGLEPIYLSDQEQYQTASKKNHFLSLLSKEDAKMMGHSVATQNKVYVKENLPKN